MQRPTDDSGGFSEPQEELGSEVSQTKREESVAGGPATDSGQSGALSVTRPAEITLSSPEPRASEARVLLGGVDTLDFGVYVEFGREWPRVVRRLEQFKRAARGTAGRLIGGRCLVLPSSGKQNYPFHLQYPDFHLYLSRNSRPREDTPNVFVSPKSELLWSVGERAAIELVQAQLMELAGGKIHECRMNRCDLSLDVLLPGGITDLVIRHYAVSHVGRKCIYLDKDDLQTIYVGLQGSDILLRIYDKSLEIAKSGKEWFLQHWGLEENADVWRFEFQVRRPILNLCEINSLDDLLTRRADLWVYLTKEWFSLRLHDDENVTRRTVHPLWQIIQDSAEHFGPQVERLKRRRVQPSLDPRHTFQQLVGKLPSYAVRKECRSLQETLQELNADLLKEFETRNFEEECQRKAIQIGIQPRKEAA